MCGKAYDPRLIFAWPSAQIAVMSGNSAAKTLLQIKISAFEAKGKKLSKEEQEQHLKEIKDTYNSQLNPYYASARLWVDGIIDPLETRKIISMGIEAANNAPLSNKFNVGVIQT
jgi:acetyl-CoA carboxylase carboxyltransferase component